MENTVKLKNKTTIGLIAILAAVILAIGLLGLSCYGSATAVGWSGGTVADGTLYVGSNAGQLVAINLSDNSTPKFSDPIEFKNQTGPLSCNALSCGSTTSTVAIYGTPAVYDNFVYIAGYDGVIYKFNVSDLNDITPKKFFQPDGKLEPFVGGPVIAQGKLFIGRSDGTIYSLDAATGDLLATYKTGDKIWGTPAVDGDTLYIGSFDKKLYAFNISTGKLNPKWDTPFETQGAIISTPLVYKGVVYIGSFDKYLYAIDANTGKEIHKFPGKNWFWAQPEIVDGIIYAGNMDGFVYIINADTMKEVTKPIDLKSPVASAPVVVGNYIVFASRNCIIYKIDTVSQSIAKIIPLNLKINVNGPLTAYEGIVYIHPQGKNMESINIDNGDVLPKIPLQK